MSTYANKRHYRVAQRDNEINNENICLDENCIKQLTIIGIAVYSISVLLSMTLGYFIGKHQ